MANEDRRCNRSFKEQTSEFGQETVEHLKKLSKAINGITEGAVNILNILKSLKEKGSLDEHICRVSMRIHLQCVRELQNLEEECNKFRNRIGKSEEEIRASKFLYDKLMKLIIQVQPLICKWQELTAEIMADIEFIQQNM